MFTAQQVQDRSIAAKLFRGDPFGRRTSPQKQVERGAVLVSSARQTASASANLHRHFIGVPHIARLGKLLKRHIHRRCDKAPIHSVHMDAMFCHLASLPSAPVPPLRLLLQEAHTGEAMMLGAEGSEGTGACRTGIAAFDRAGLRWSSGGLYLVLGGPMSGKTALLLELAMRHVETAPGHAVLIMETYPVGSVCIRLFAREVERIRADREKAAPPLFKAWDSPQNVAGRRLQRLILDGRLQLGEAPILHRKLQFAAPPEPVHVPGGRTPSLVVVDVDLLAPRTSPQAVAATLLAHVPPGAPVPPLVVSARVPGRHLGATHRGAIPAGLLAPLQGFFDTADAVITLQREPSRSRRLRAYIRHRQLDLPAASIELRLTPRGAIEAD